MIMVSRAESLLNQSREAGHPRVAHLLSVEDDAEYAYLLLSSLSSSSSGGAGPRGM